MLVNDNLRFGKFESGDGSCSIYLEMKNYFDIKQSNVIFVQKISYDSDIRKHLEKEIA